MLPKLLLLFTLLPLVEFALLVQIERLIGLAGTIGLILATGAVGAVLARREGLRTLTELKTQTRVAGLPSQAIAEGVLVLVAAAVLLTPGVLTDLLGFSLLVPAIRKRVAWLAIARGKQKLAATVQAKAASFTRRAEAAAWPRQRDDDIIDVEFETVRPRDSTGGHIG